MKDRRQLIHWLGMALLSLILLIVAAACGGAPQVDWDVAITGSVGNPTSVSYAELVKMDQVDLTDLLMEKSMGEDEVHSWVGASLDEILAKAEVSDLSGGVTAIAADGYAVDIPEEELKDAIIALKRDGEWITDAEPDKGPVRLVCPETPANRWVFQITEINVK